MYGIERKLFLTHRVTYANKRTIVKVYGGRIELSGLAGSVGEERDEADYRQEAKLWAYL